MDSEGLLTVDEAAARLRVHPESLRRWLREGRVKGYRISRRAGWRIPDTEVQRVLREGLPNARPATDEMGKAAA